MKILVYGAGAVGGYIGGRLSQHGHDVTLLVRQVASDAINAYGLKISENHVTEVVKPQTLTSIPQAFSNGTTYDLIIMGMKSYDLKSALDPLVAFCSDPAMIITTQNGIGVENVLIQQYGAERIIAGSFTLALSKEATNQIVVQNEGGLGLAPTQPKQKIKEWVKLFNEAGIRTAGLKDYQAMKWSKALMNIVGNASSAILNRPTKVIYKSEMMFDLEMRMLRETLDVMKSLKLKIVDLPGWSPGRLSFGVRRLPNALFKPILSGIVARGRGDKMPSFHIDLNAGKGKSEVLFHNGAIAKAGQECSVPTPVNAALADILHKIVRKELDWRDFDGRPKKLFAEVRRWEKTLGV
ncbi:MAG: ketopantoate reductase family protein [Chloroflexi bacterium]|nr:ketopantoate reductase family protein [Chloroflexota bacterium]